MWEFFGGLASGAASIYNSLFNRGAQERENQLIREREDTAVQRRAKDLEAAGLSKTLAAGSAASTSVTSSPQMAGNGYMDAIAAAANVQGIKNAKEENANLRKSRQVMDSDMALKFGQMQKEFAQADYFGKAAENQAQDVLLKQEQAKLFAQQVLESLERTKGYQYSALNQHSQSQLNYWKAANEMLDNALIYQTGLRSSTGGLTPSIIKGIFQGYNNMMDIFKVDRPGSNPYFKEMERGFVWTKR